MTASGPVRIAGEIGGTVALRREKRGARVDERHVMLLRELFLHAPGWACQEPRTPTSHAGRRDLDAMRHGDEQQLDAAPIAVGGEPFERGLGLPDGSARGVREMELDGQ